MNCSRLVMIMLVSVTTLLAFDAAARHAQAQHSTSNERFVYVGLSTTICRIEPASGNLWVLRNANERLTLQGVPTAAGWRWQSVNLSDGQSSPRPASQD